MCTSIRTDANEFYPTRVLIRYPEDAEDEDYDVESSDDLYSTLLDAKIAQAEWAGDQVTKARRKVRMADAEAARAQVQLDKLCWAIRKLQGKDYV